MTMVRLRTIAHSRSGDKGNLNSLSAIAYDKSGYAFLAATLTAELVREHLSFRVTGRVDRYLCPALRTVHFVVERAPSDTVSTSTFADTHGKSLSSALLELELDVSDAIIEAAQRNLSTWPGHAADRID